MPVLLTSAKFKRDYVAAFAVAFFFAIVGSEFALAFGIPLLLKYSSMYAEQECRQRMLDNFDRARGMARRKVEHNVMQGERELILWSLDSLALYLRRYNTKMPMDEINATAADIDDFLAILDTQSKLGAFCRPVALDTALYLKHTAKSFDDSEKMPK